MLDMNNMTYLSTLPLFVNNLCFCHLKTRLKTCGFTQQWLVQLLLMASYLVTIVANSHQTCVKMCLRDMDTAHHPPPLPSTLVRPRVNAEVVMQDSAVKRYSARFPTQLKLSSKLKRRAYR